MTLRERPKANAPTAPLPGRVPTNSTYAVRTCQRARIGSIVGLLKNRSVALPRGATKIGEMMALMTGSSS
jgi:hypothetical protein